MYFLRITERLEHEVMGLKWFRCDNMCWKGMVLIYRQKTYFLLIQHREELINRSTGIAPR